MAIAWWGELVGVRVYRVLELVALGAGAAVD
jgi:hypothetical protein